MRTHVWGVGTTEFGRRPEKLPAELAWEAIAEAFADAGVDSVDAVYVGTVFGSPGVAQRALSGAGVTEVPIVTVENACASGTTAYHEGLTAIEEGRHERVLALGIEMMTPLFDGPIAPDPTDAEQASGLLMPAMYAMSATRYLATHEASVADLAQVAVKNSANGALNPRAQRRQGLSEEEILGSRMIAEPLTLYQCAGISDAAAAVVLGGEARDRRDVPVRASALRSGAAWGSESEHIWGFEIVRDTAAEVYEQAGVGPEEIDVLEVHDAFTIGEIVTVEALGLAAEGGAPARLRAGEFAIGGAQAVNPSGGLLARGHPLGATGLAQLAEVTWQLRGEAKGRQVESPRTALVETMGGGASGLDGNGCVVTILGG